MNFSEVPTHYVWWALLSEPSPPFIKIPPPRSAPLRRYVYGTTMQAGRLVLDLADMHQRTTQSYVRRPYGVGMLVAAHDQTGPHLFQTCPSGNYFEYVAMAIGARSQSAKTYLEKHFEEFEVRGRRCLRPFAACACARNARLCVCVDVLNRI